MLNVLPSLFTIFNFICGFLAILAATTQKIELAILLIFVGCLFDSVDGRVARKFNAVSSFGKELDSLADVVTFGVAPSIIVYMISLHEVGLAGLGVVILFSVCGLIRLARFNVKQSELSTFIGLPIPLAALCLLGMSLILQPFALIFGACLLAYLMISQIKFPNFKKSTSITELENGHR